MKTLDTADALEQGIRALKLLARPEGSDIHAAITTLEMIRDQRGCEHFDAACNGRLADLIDIIVFG